MNCPLCSAATDVVETKNINGIVIRRRHCYNDHSFKTQELAITTPKPRRILKSKSSPTGNTEKQK